MPRRERQRGKMGKKADHGYDGRFCSAALDELGPWVPLRILPRASLIELAGEKEVEESAKAGWGRSQATGGA